MPPLQPLVALLFFSRCFSHPTSRVLSKVRTPLTFQRTSARLGKPERIFRRRKIEIQPEVSTFGRDCQTRAQPNVAARTVETELVRFTRQHLASGVGGAFIVDGASLKDDVKLVSPLWKLQGKNSYLQSVSAWRQNFLQLQEVETIVTELVEPVLGRGQIRIRWQARWVPQDMMWLSKLRKKLPGRLELSVPAVGEPLAVVHGVTFMEFKKNNITGNYELAKQTDELEMEKIFSDQRIEERRLSLKIYEDLVLFMATRRPLGWTTSDWTQRVLALLDLSSVGAQRLNADAATFLTDPEERRKRTRRGQLGVGLGLVATAGATLWGAMLREEMEMYEREEMLLERLMTKEDTGANSFMSQPEIKAAAKNVIHEQVEPAAATEEPTREALRSEPEFGGTNVVDMPTSFGGETTGV